MKTDTPETDAERRKLKKSKSYPTDPVPADFARKLERERNAWQNSAAEFLTDSLFYRDLLHQIGEPFGQAAKTSDDGSIQEDVLVLKVPELVEQLRKECNAAREALSGRTVSCSQCNELANKLAANEAYQMGLIAERDEAREALENHLALTIHTCSPYCQRPLCVANRQISEMREVIKEAHTDLSNLLGIINDSEGVAGWHRNGAIASWDELEINPVAALSKLQPFLKP